MPGQFVDTWDSGLFGANWDAGLQWDVNVGPAPGDVTPYLNLLRAEHRDKIKLTEAMTATIQPLVDSQVLLARLQTIFDLDSAVGDQLDQVGKWIGASRQLSVPLPDVWFSWNVVGLGWNEGSWRDPLDPTTEAVILPDDAYRTLLRAKAVNNRWDGTIPNAYTVWDTFFAGTGWTIDIHDHQDMTMDFVLRGPQPDAITMALLTNGFFDLKPMAVTATYSYTP